MSSNTPIHWLVRPAVRRLAHTAVSPNHLTTWRCVTGVAAAVAFAQGGTAWPAIGGAVFVLSMLLDRADGELARLTGRFSAFGAQYDIAADCGANMLAMLGIGIGLADSAGAWGPLLGTVAGLGIGALFWQVHVLSLGTPQGYAISGSLSVDGDDALVLVPVAVWCGAALPMLAVAAVVTPLAAIWLVTRRPLATKHRPATKHSAGEPPSPRETVRAAPCQTAPGE